MDWYQLKVAVSEATGISHDALHILAGVVLQILLAALLRVRLSHFLPWAVVLGLEIANEWLDLRYEVWPDRTQQWGETLKDLLVTLAIPTILLVLTRWHPRLFAPQDLPTPVPLPSQDPDSTL